MHPVCRYLKWAAAVFSLFPDVLAGDHPDWGRHADLDASRVISDKAVLSIMTSAVDSQLIKIIRQKSKGILMRNIQSYFRICSESTRSCKRLEKWLQGHSMWELVGLRASFSWVLCFPPNHPECSTYWMFRHAIFSLVSDSFAQHCN